MATYIDLTLKNSEVTEITDEAAINNSLRNIFSTPVGSVPGKPKYGSRIFTLLFSQMDYATEMLMREIIREEIAKYEPRITILSLSFSNQQEYNRMVINLKYSFTVNGIEKDSSFSLAVSQ